MAPHRERAQLCVEERLVKVVLSHQPDVRRAELRLGSTVSEPERDAIAADCDGRLGDGHPRLVRAELDEPLDADLSS